MKGYYKHRKSALELLRTKLPNELYYHSLEHTQEVLRTCKAYIKRDNIPEHEDKLLRLGALTHDIGLTISNENHDLHGKVISTEWMKELNFAESDIRVVQGLIMATRIPQSPKNELEKILCDADLDYLGRSDFYKISKKLYNEL